MERRRLNGYLISLVAAVSWAGTSPGISYLVRAGVPSLAIALWRDVFVALAIFALLGVFRPAALRLDRPTFRAMAIAGAVSIGLYHILWVLSVKLNGPPLAVVLVYTYNGWVALGARFFFKEPLRRNQVFALLLSLAGLVLAVQAYDPAVWRTSGLGILIGVASAIVQAVYVLANQRFIKNAVNPLASLGYQMAFGALAIFSVALVFDPGQITAISNPNHWLLLVFLGIGPTLGGYGFFNLAMRYIPGKIAGLITVLEVPVAALLTYLLFGESLNLPQYAGMLLVLIASVLANLGPGEAQ